MIPTTTEKGLLNAFQLKLIALFFMTVDHLAVYQILTKSHEINGMMRIFGRIAAPLFLFLLVQGLLHTRSKKKYITRLYVAGVLIGIGNCLYVPGLFMVIGNAQFFYYAMARSVVSFGNILPTLMYTALYITCIESFIGQIKTRDYKRSLLPLLFMVVPLVFVWVHWYSMTYLHHAPYAVNLIQIFAPSPFVVEYSPIFIALGIVWYFIHDQSRRCMIFACLCVFSFLIPVQAFLLVPVTILQREFFTGFHLFVNIQWCMILALPFMLLYNGEKGRGSKYLFYFYYPLHQYLLCFLQLLMMI